MGILEKTYLNKHKGLLRFAYVGRGYGVEVTLLPAACWASVWGVSGAVIGSLPSLIFQHWVVWHFYCSCNN